MIVNLHVPQLWLVYSILIMQIYILWLWIFRNTDWFEIEYRKYKLPVDMWAMLSAFAPLLLGIILGFIVYLWIYVFKIKIITGV